MTTEISNVVLFQTEELTILIFYENLNWNDDGKFRRHFQTLAENDYGNFRRRCENFKFTMLYKLKITLENATVILIKGC